jgi:hypothetical protein
MRDNHRGNKVDRSGKKTAFNAINPDDDASSEGGAGGDVFVFVSLGDTIRGVLGGDGI